MNAASLSRRLFAFCMISTLIAVAGERGATVVSHTQADPRPKPKDRPGDRLIAEGLAALDRGDDTTARSLFERALAADPRNAEAHTYLGVLADRAGDLAAAERHFAAAARLAPRSARARNNHGAILLRLDRIPEATAEFEASLRLDPKQAKALVNLARVRFDSGTPQGWRAADELFSRADALAPDVEIARALTIIALRLGERERAAVCYRTYVMRLSSATGEPPASARSDLGGALFEAGLLAEAETELNAALTLDPANDQTVLRLARVYLTRKEFPAAGRTLEAALARKVETPAIYALLAVVYEKSGHIENAIPAMRMAIQLDPQSEKYHFQYGILLTENNAPAAALIRLNEALQSFPKSSRLQLGLGLANLKLSRNEEAVRAFKRAIELDPEFAPTYAYLGITRVLVGQSEEGARCFEQALQKSPNIAIIHYLLADALLKQPDTAVARIEKGLKRALELDAGYAPARLALGKLHAREGRLPEAVAEFEEVIKLVPNLAEGYYHLGRTLNRLERTAEAQAALATYKRLSDLQKQQEQDEQRDIMRRLADVVF
jgi:Tfp pilus assembly protein PilF